MATLFSPMTKTQYAQTLEQLDLSNRAIGVLFGLSPRTSRMYAAGDLRVPISLAIALRLIEQHVPYAELEPFRSPPKERP